MAGGAKLVIEIITDASKASAGLDEASGKFGKFGDTLGKMQGPALGIVAGITAAGAATVGAASDMQQAMGGVDAVFGDSSDTVKKWAADAASSVGLSATQYAEFASTMGAQLKNMGVPMEDVAGQTDEMIRLGADLAATYGGTTADAVSALGGAMRGEGDAAEKYGLGLSASAVAARMAADGTDQLEGSAASAAKAQAIMALATEQAGGAMGQAAREADTTAGQQQRLQATLADTAATIGTALLPVVAAVAGALADMAGWVQKNSAWILPLVGVIGALAAGILIANAAMSAWATIQAVAKGVSVAYTAVQAALNAVMAANPIGIIIIAIVALVAAFIWLWNNVEGFRNFFIGIWEGIQAAVAAVTAWIQTAWAAVAAWFKSVWSAVSSFFTGLWQGIVAVVNSVVNTIRGVVGAVAKFFEDQWRNAVADVQNVIKILQGVFTSVFNAIMVPINAVIGAFQTVVGWIQKVIDWLGRIKVPDVLGAIGGIFGGGKSAPAAMATAGGFAAGARLAPSGRAVTGGGPTYNITVNGGLDSADTIARRIDGVMRSRARRTGGVVINRAVTP